MEQSRALSAQAIDSNTIAQERPRISSLPLTLLDQILRSAVADNRLAARAARLVCQQWADLLLSLVIELSTVRSLAEFEKLSSRVPYLQSLKLGCFITRAEAHKLLPRFWTLGSLECKWAPTGVPHFPELPALQKLSFTGISAYGLEGFANLAALQELKLVLAAQWHSEKLATMSLLPLGCLEQLTALHLKLGKPGARQQGSISGLSALTQLRALILDGRLPTPPADLAFLTGLQNLALLTSQPFNLSLLAELRQLEGLTMLATKADIPSNAVFMVSSQLPTRLDLSRLLSLRCFELRPPTTSGNETYSIQALAFAPDLESLKLTKFEAVDTSRFVDSLPNVRDATIDVTYFRGSRPLQLGQLMPAAERINIAYLGISPNLSGLTRLRKLRYGCCAEAGVIQGLGELTALEQLEVLGSSSLTSLEGLELCGQLITLELHLLPKLEVAASLGLLSSLQELHIRGCPELTGLPALGGLTELRKLSVRDCRQLIAMPDLGGLAALESLELLDLDALASVPGLGSVVGLRTLHMAQLPALTAMDGLAELTKLTALHLLPQSKTEQPGPCITALAELRHLGLDGSFSYPPSQEPWLDLRRLAQLNSLAMMQSDWGNRDDLAEWIMPLKVQLTRLELRTNQPTHDFEELRAWHLEELCKAATHLVSALDAGCKHAVAWKIAADKRRCIAVAHP